MVTDEDVVLDAMGSLIETYITEEEGCVYELAADGLE